MMGCCHTPINTHERPTLSSNRNQPIELPYKSIHWALYNVFSPFHATGFFLYPLKISKNLWLSGGIKRDQWHEMSSWVNHSLFQIQHKAQHKHWNEPFFQNSNELIVMAEFETRTPTLFPNCTFKNTKADQFDKLIQNPVNYLRWSFLLK